MEGAGVRLRRAFGNDDPSRFDPFLLLDDFRGDDPDDYSRGFPSHPHRGMETITYVLAGTVEHRDSLGSRGTIGPGDVQWMTAGSGIIHQEMPKGNALGEMWGFQLWANLPAAQKMMHPRYQEVTRDEIPVVTTPEGATVRVIAGRAAGVEGPVRGIVTEPVYLDVELPAHGRFRQPTDPAHTAFAYVFEGRGRFDAKREPVANHTLVHFGPGDAVEASTDDEPVRFLLVTGRPLGEPIAWHGPIVMNTQDELRQAFRDLDQGTFVRRRG